MNARKSLAQAVAERNGCTAALAGQVLEAFLEALLDAIIRGDRIEIRGFGTFAVKKANARPGARNPRTGDRVSVPARRKVMFRPGKVLKAALHNALDDETPPVFRSNPVARPSVTASLPRHPL